MNKTPSGYPTSARSYGEIERKAAFARSVVCKGLDEFEAVPGVSLFEHLNDYRTGDTPMSYAVGDCPGEGMTIFDAEKSEILIVLNTRTYHALEGGDPRARFTLGHEFGHAVLHREHLKRLGLMPHEKAGAMHRAEKTHEFFRDTEWQANAFASAILMPARGLAHLEARQRLTANIVSHTYGVSYTAAENRLSCFLKRRSELLM